VPQSTRLHLARREKSFYPPLARMLLRLSHHSELSRLRKKSICGVALHLSSLQRTSMYASFLKIRAPCIWSFLLCRLPWRLLTKSSIVSTCQADSHQYIPSSYYLQASRSRPACLFFLGRGVLSSGLVVLNQEFFNAAHGDLVHVKPEDVAINPQAESEELSVEERGQFPG
jgi:hypothetical protein